MENPDDQRNGGDEETAYNPSLPTELDDAEAAGIKGELEEDIFLLESILR